MRHYTSIGPNPAVVKTFMRLKNLDVPTEKVDIMQAENREDAHLARNPSGQLPCLQLDNGSYLSEITAICEYLEELQPEPALIGTTPEERAETRMWTRRIDLNVCENMANAFRYSEGLPMFKSRIRVIPQAAEDLKTLTREKLAWLNGLMAGKTWICGDRFTLADILPYCFIQFGATVGQPLSEDLENLQAWIKRVQAKLAP